MLPAISVCQFNSLLSVIFNPHQRSSAKGRPSPMMGFGILFWNISTSASDVFHHPVSSVTLPCPLLGLPAVYKHSVRITMQTNQKINSIGKLKCANTNIIL